MQRFDPRDIDVDFDVQQYLHPDDRETAAKAVEALGAREPFTVECRIVDADGAVRMLHARCEIVLDGASAPARFSGTAQEAPAQGQAALHESAELYRSVIEQARDVVFTLSRDGLITTLNPAFEAITGWSPGDWIGRPFAALLHPEDRANAADVIRRTLQGESIGATERRMFGRNGDLLIGEFTTTALRLNGVVHGVAGIARDITQRKRTEEAMRESSEKFRGLLDSTPDAIVITDQDGRIAFANAQTERLFGYTRQELEGTMVEILVPARFRTGQRRDREASPKTARVRPIGTGIQLFGLRKDGTEFPAEISLSPIVSEGRTLVATAIRDVTERHHIIEELAKSRDAALKSAALKSQFLATMSHEVRTPLNGILGMASLLLDTELSPQARTYAETLQSSGQALLAIVNDILDLTKIEAGKLTFETIAFDVRDVVGSVMDLLGPQARSKGLEFDAVVSDDVPSRLYGDGGRLSQALMNLVGNAIKFTDVGDVLIRVSCQHDEETRTTLRFDVSDTGIGIPADAHGRLFTPFSQVDPSAGGKYGGTGLGLAISKHLVEQMGGSIGLQSVEGQGSTFWFTARFDKEPPHDLVAAEADGFHQSASRPPAAAAARPMSLVPSNRRARVLVAEDNPVNRQILVHQLNKLGCTADAVENGIDVLSALAMAPYDLILMDCRMPKLDGYETAAQIRRQEGSSHRTPIIAVTAYAMPSDREKCLAAGMDDYLSKPLRVEQLAEALHKWCRTGPASADHRTPNSARAGAVALIDVAPSTDQDGDILRELIDAFLADTPVRLDAIRAASGAGDTKGLADAAHMLKGSCGLLGTHRMARLCSQLEAAMRSGLSTAAAAPLVKKLEAEFASVRSRLEEKWGARL